MFHFNITGTWIIFPQSGNQSKSGGPSFYQSLYVRPSCGFVSKHQVISSENVNVCLHWGREEEPHRREISFKRKMRFGVLLSFKVRSRHYQSVWPIDHKLWRWRLQEGTFAKLSNLGMGKCQGAEQFLNQSSCFGLVLYLGSQLCCLHLLPNSYTPNPILQHELACFSLTLPFLIPSG